MYPTAEGFHDGTDGRRDRFTVDEWAGIDGFPFRSTELSLLAVSDRVIDLAETLLADTTCGSPRPRRGRSTPAPPTTTSRSTGTISTTR